MNYTLLACIWFYLITNTYKRRSFRLFIWRDYWTSSRITIMAQCMNVSRYKIVPFFPNRMSLTTHIPTI